MSSSLDPSDVVHVEMIGHATDMWRLAGACEPACRCADARPCMAIFATTEQMIHTGSKVHAFFSVLFEKPRWCFLETQ